MDPVDAVRSKTVQTPGLVYGVVGGSELAVLSETQDQVPVDDDGDGEMERWRSGVAVVTMDGGTDGQS